MWTYIHLHPKSNSVDGDDIFNPEVTWDYTIPHTCTYGVLPSSIYEHGYEVVDCGEPAPYYCYWYTTNDPSDDSDDGMWLCEYHFEIVRQEEER